MRIHGSIVRVLLFGALALPAAAHGQAGAAAPGQIADLSEEAFATFQSEGAERAEPLFARVLQLNRAAHGERHPDTITSLSNHAFVLMTLGRLQDAEPLYAKVLGLSREVLGERHPDTLQSRNDYGLILEKLGRLKEAEPHYAEALRLRREVLGPRDPNTVISLNNYALVVNALGRAAEAEPLMAEALRLFRETKGERDTDTLQALGNYAFLLDKLGRTAEAEPLMAGALRLNREVLGQAHPYTLKSLNNHAYLLFRLGRGKEAEPHFADALKLSRDTLGREHPDTLVTLNNYASMRQATGRGQDAEPLYAEALAITRRTLGEKHPDTIRAVNNYAGVLDDIGRSSEAEPLYAEALRLRREVLGESHPDTIRALGNYAGILRTLGRPREAEALYAQALRASRDAVGEKHPDTLLAMSNYASLLIELDRPDEAAPLYADALRSSRATLGERHPDTLRVMSNYAYALDRFGRNVQAGPLYAEALRLRREVLGDNHPDTLDSMNNYAFFLEETGQAASAGPLLAEAFERRRAAQGESHPRTLLSAGNLAYFLLASTATPEDAFEPARFAAEGLRRRRDALGDDPKGSAQRDREQQRQSGEFQLLADAAWVAQASAGKAVHQSEAFAAVQDVLAGSASRAIAQSAARRAAEKAGGLGALARERQQLADRWLAAETALTAALAETGPGAEERRANLRAQLSGLEARMVAIDAQLRRDAPDYFALVRPEDLSIEEARGLLRNDEAALMLMPTGFGTHVMLVTREGLTWERSAWTADQVDAAVRRLLWDVGADVPASMAESLAWQDEGEGAYPFAFATAHTLYEQLIAPVAAGLNGKTHLFVMATGRLSSLPLGMLVSEVPQGAHGDPDVLRSAKWLADQYALIQAPSLQSIRFLRQFRSGSRGSAAKSFLGFGDPVLEGEAQLRGSRNAAGAQAGAGGFDRLFAGGPVRGGGVANVGELRRMARLPGTADELQAMWQAFGKPAGALYLDQAASEPAVKGARLDASVIAFATHGLVAGELRGVAEPGLVLTPPAQASAADDGYLAMSEVAGLAIDADWVILSACNSAAGDGSEGASGLSGLARAFFYAGARNLLASDWPVRDDVAARLTVRTVEIARTRPDLSRAQAFQQAMREIRHDKAADTDTDTWAHPNAWAPFVLVGDR